MVPESPRVLRSLSHGENEGSFVGRSRVSNERESTRVVSHLNNESTWPAGDPGEVIAVSVAEVPLENLGIEQSNVEFLQIRLVPRIHRDCLKQRSFFNGH